MPSHAFDWTIHANRRATLRRIAKADAERVYTEYDTERPGHKPGTRMLIGTIDGVRLKIVVDDRGDAIIVITVADVQEFPE